MPYITVVLGESGYARNLDPDEVSHNYSRNDYTYFKLDYSWMSVTQPENRRLVHWIKRELATQRIKD